MFLFSSWVESILVALLALVGVFLARWFSRQQAPFWMWGYFIPLAMLAVLLVVGYSAHQQRRLEFVFPFSWLMGGRVVFAALAFIATMILTTPLLKLPRPRERVLLALLLAWFVGQISIWPFLSPVFDRPRLAALPTVIDGDGVCRQGTSYTCGPAAAVTLLRRAGLSANESELAILARTTKALGTPPTILCRVLQNRYRADGLVCRYRPFESIDDLSRAGPTLAVMKFGFLADHYVAVLEVSDDNVMVGDPLHGRTTLPRRQFAERWRHVGIVLERPAVPGQSSKAEPLR